MTENEFWLGLDGDPIRTKDQMTRIRYIVEEELRKRAKEVREEGRPDKAGRLIWAAGQIRMGRPVTKRVSRLLAKDLEICKQRLVDGVPIGSYPGED